MKKKYQNGFFIFGLVLLGIMVTQLDFAEVWRGLQHTGYWFFAVLGLWMALYTINTSAWYIIIKAGQGQETTNSHLADLWGENPTALCRLRRRLVPSELPLRLYSTP